MDWTDLAFSQILEQEIQEWKKFRWALRTEAHQTFDYLLGKGQASLSSWEERLKPLAVCNNPNLHTLRTGKGSGWS